MLSDLIKLNKEQKEAVSHKKGPLLIVAGAGTGKTTVIAQRIINLIEKREAKPEEILAVTFTEKAAGELEERVDRALPYGYVDLWISTFHSFCERVLREHALDIGLPANFKILDQTAGWLLLRQNINKLELNYYRPMGNPAKFLQALISHFSHCKDQGVYPEDYLEYADKLKTRDDAPEESETQRIREVANAYHAYQRLLLENSSLDFGDLLNFCLKLFKKRPLILKKYREKFKYILVDEFQDTNWIQYELIKILAEPRNNLTVCADDDQAIYRWRGASFTNIVQFKKDFPKAKQISLIENYRSFQNILDQAYKFIKANDPDRLEYVNKISKKLTAKKKGQGIVEHIFAKRLDGEVGKVINKILEILKREKNATYNDFAILVRANDTAIPFIKALERAGLPYQFLASQGLYSKPIILDLISYFKLLDNYHESSALYRVLNLPFLRISDQDIMKLTQYSYRKAKSLYETLEDLPLIPGISEKTRTNISFILSLIKKHTALGRDKSVSEVMAAFFSDSGYLKYLAKGNNKEDIDLLNQFYRKVKSFEEKTINPSLKNFMEEIMLEMESGEEGKLEFDPDQGPDMIKIMTIHGAKGLEFNYVFLVGMVDKRFPSIERKEPIELPTALIKDIKPKGDVHLQEERRICYVAMTRAKKGLYFTSAEDYGGSRTKKLSRFLIEMGYSDRASKNEKTEKEKNLILESENSPKIKNTKQGAGYLPERFSFSQLAAFKKCPLQYKFNFILRIPVKGKAVFSFGKTMHKVLFEFLKQASSGKNREQDNLFGSDAKKADSAKDIALTNFDCLKELYEKNWIDEWYENKKQKEEYYELGKKLIRDFYNDFSENPSKILRIDNIAALEMPFNLKIAGYALRGVIDRIDGTCDSAVIIDYKTGRQKEKLTLEDKEQLLIYQIAAEEIFKIKLKELTYYYLEGGKRASFLGTEEEKEQTKVGIIEEIKNIKKSDFAATPGWQCGYCDFKDICDFAER